MNHHQQQHYRSTLASFTDSEDELLRELILLKQVNCWDELAKEFSHTERTAEELKKRWQQIRPPSNFEVVERRKWSHEEDRLLGQLVQKYGQRNWRMVASHFQGRLPKQCRERWINHVDPDISKRRITDKDWEVIVAAQKQYGNRWSEIAKLLPGRTPNQIKNHWHAMQRKRANSKRTKDEAAELSDDISDPEIDDTDSRPRKRARFEETYSQPVSMGMDDDDDDFKTSKQAPSDWHALCQIALEMYDIEQQKRETSKYATESSPSPPPSPPQSPPSPIPPAPRSPSSAFKSSSPSTFLSRPRIYLPPPPAMIAQINQSKCNTISTTASSLSPSAILPSAESTPVSGSILPSISVLLSNAAPRKEESTSSGSTPSTVISPSSASWSSSEKKIETNMCIDKLCV